MKDDNLAWARQLNLEEMARNGEKTGKFELGSKWWQRAHEHIKELGKAHGKKR